MMTGNTFSIMQYLGRGDYPVIVSETTLLLAFSGWADTPGKPSLTSLAKGAEFTNRYVSDP